MHYGLGIDTGGTYTDAVLLRGSDGVVVDSKKAFTTYPDLQVGISRALDSLDHDLLHKVNLVSVSTTLSTNSLLEGTGTPVGLVLIGQHPADMEFPTPDLIVVSGGHGPSGEEEASLDIGSIREFGSRTKDTVEAYAISAFFGTRNPEHELKAKSVIQEITGKPVVCGHELCQELGAYERAVTAVLNAQLIPITHHFVSAVMADIRNRGINARMLMLKCDGSVYNLEDALDKPIETIFSGPAASLLGASYLAKLDTCAAIDVGGTSTDISAIYHGVPEISASGSVIGGWKTRVKAMKMETSATGGDSHVWVMDGEVMIGPRRVIPLCVAAVTYAGLLQKLNLMRLIPRKSLSENYQPTKFLVRTEYSVNGLSKEEAEILQHIGNEPVSINELNEALHAMPSGKAIDSLIKKRLVQAIGFTPTDALHVRGEYTAWDVDAANAGAELLSRYTGIKKYEFCTSVKEHVARNMARNQMTFLLPERARPFVDEMLSGLYPAKFSVKLPIVLLGGPVRAYAKEMAAFLDGEIIVPDHADVGNAVGALAGKGVKRVEVLIMPSSIEKPTEDFLIFYPGGREQVVDYREAFDRARQIGLEIVHEYETRCGVSREETKVNVSVVNIAPENWPYPPLETRITIVGVGDPMMIIKE
ncbi:MAG: hydantoinase/oxoprolinase family protein [Methanolobus sp.]|uniref:hydantoinase/oxoprolinase family protein n=1 Tax=Methanolobus sp. TaxID=1874737 RepID=UPI002731ACD3|nr:hydantoinase/oxoprolinase family protein [Methanolobus sp.]MDP2217099.1 hydantoinase/oxoprolinase family protein [Methanolobus sp.]